MFKKIAIALFTFLLCQSVFANNIPLATILHDFYYSRSNENLLLKVVDVKIIENDAIITTEVLNMPFNAQHPTITMHVDPKDNLQVNDKLMFTNSADNYYLNKDNIIIGKIPNALPKSAWEMLFTVLLWMSGVAAVYVVFGLFLILAGARVA